MQDQADRVVCCFGGLPGSRLIWSASPSENDLCRRQDVP